LGQVTQIVSVGQGRSAANYFSMNVSITPDGRFVAFTSYASNLVPGDTNNTSDVFIYDRQNASTERVSVDSFGNQADSHSGAGTPSMSADGRYVVFDSVAHNLVPGDTNNTTDVFLRDRQNGSTTRVSVGLGGAQGDGSSDSPQISADGRFIAFHSSATNLIPGDTNGMNDIFVYEIQSGAMTRASVDSTGTQQANNGASQASISSDGRYVAFASYSTTLVPGDGNVACDIFVHDMQSGSTVRVSVDSSGVEGNHDSFSPSISADGRFVTFLSRADNLVPGDTNGFFDVFVHDMQSGTTERVSIDSNGNEENAAASGVSYISADGRYVAFCSPAANLVPGDTNGQPDVFLRDRWNGTTERVSVNSLGLQGNGESGTSGIAISPNGRFVAFESGASNLVGDDTNTFPDIFLHDRAPSGFTSLCDPGTAGVITCPCGNPPSGPSRGCNNSSATGGASLSVAGAAYVSEDSLVFTTSGEKPTALSVFSQGSAVLSTPLAFGQGVRCVGVNLKRLYITAAAGGVASAPSPWDPDVHTRSAMLGDPIAAGSARYYYVYYRDPVVLGGCPSTSTFNTTQSARIDWSL
jgi:Tol biopolymer transport system component